MYTEFIHIPSYFIFILILYKYLFHYAFYLSVSKDTIKHHDITNKPQYETVTYETSKVNIYEWHSPMEEPTLK
jgi:hypothetical protein